MREQRLDDLQMPVQGRQVQCRPASGNDGRGGRLSKGSKDKKNHTSCLKKRSMDNHPTNLVSMGHRSSFNQVIIHLRDRFPEVRHRFAES